MGVDHRLIIEIIRGLRDAEESYKKWITQNYWNEPPEFVSTVSIANRLCENLEYAVTLEDGIGGVLKNTKQRPGKTKSSLNRSGRFDIVVWGEEDYGPIGVIEVKKVRNFSEPVKSDLHRICSTLDKSKTIEWGLLAFTTRWWPKKTLNSYDRLTTKMDTVFENIEDFIANERDVDFSNKTIQRHPGDVVVTWDYDSGHPYEQFAWRAEVIEISRTQHFL